MEEEEEEDETHNYNGVFCSNAADLYSWAKAIVLFFSPCARRVRRKRRWRKKTR